MKYLKQTLFMILLLLTLPLISAVQIKQISVVGKAGVPNVIQENDSLLFTILVDLDGQTGITPGDISNQNILIVRGSNSFPVSSCSWKDQSLGLIECTKTLNMQTSSSSTYYFDVILSNVYFNPRPLLYLDTKAPDYYSTTISAIQKGSYINYTVTSKDVVNSQISKCSGLNKVDLYLKKQISTGFEVKKIGENYFKGNCFETLTGVVQTTSGYEGDVSFCVQINDLFGNNGSMKCTSLTLDTVPPDITNAKLYSPQGTPLNNIMLSSGGYLKLGFDVFDSKGIDYSKLMVEGKEVEIGVSNVKTNTMGITVSYLSKQIFIDSKFISSGGLLIAEITAYDSSGNSKKLTPSFQLTVDSIGPESSLVEGKIKSNGCYLVTDIDNVTVTFKEDGVGLNLADVFLRVKSSLVPADYCLKESTNWKCYFNDINFGVYGEGRFEVGVDASSKDDLGNFGPQNAAANFCLDSTPPRVESIIVSGESQLGRVLGIVSANGVVVLNISYVDSSPVEITANFSNLGMPDGTFSSSYNIVKKLCDKSPCEIKSKTIGPNSDWSEDISLTLTDAVGLQFKTTTRIKILNVQSDVQNVVDYELDLSPKGIDREIGKILNQKIFANIKLKNGKEAEGNLIILDASFNNCLSAPNLSSNFGGAEYIALTDYIGNTEDKLNHYLLFQMKATDYFIDEVRVNCLFSIAAYDDNNVYPNVPLIVSVKIPFFNNPIDMPDVALQKKIDDAVDETEGMFETLDKIYKFISFLEMVCNIYNTIVTAWTSIQTIVSVLSSVTPYFDSVGTEACFISDTTGKTSEKGLFDYISKFCKWVSCDYSFFDMLDGFSDPNSGTNADEGFYKYMNTGFGLDDGKGMAGSVSRLSYKLADSNGYLDNDNLIANMLNLCLPSIFKKIHEWRAIKCSYVVCLIDQAELGIGNEAICEELKSSAECEYIFGQVFSMIPFLSIFDAVIDKIITMISDPIAMGFMAVHYLCTQYCEVNLKAHDWCTVPELAMRLTASFASLSAIIKNAGNLLDSASNEKICEDMEDRLDALKDSSRAFQEEVNSAKGGSKK